FHQFLNLANIADQEFFSGPAAGDADALAACLAALSARHGRDALRDLLAELRLEVVLTAHPTEARPRSLIHSYDEVAPALGPPRSPSASTRGWAGIATAIPTSPERSPGMSCCSGAGRRPTSAWRTCAD